MGSMVAVQSIMDMTLDEIKAFHNTQLLRYYYKIIETMKIDNFSKKIVEENIGESLGYIQEVIEEARLDLISEYYCPGDPVILYPSTKEVYAKKEYTCDFSGAKINIGSLYVNYRPMIKNMNTGDTYVLKRSIKVETYYERFLPTDIIELEEMNNKIMNYSVQDDRDICYDHLYWQTGGRLSFQKLNRR